MAPGFQLAYDGFAYRDERDRWRDLKQWESQFHACGYQSQGHRLVDGRDTDAQACHSERGKPLRVFTEP